MLATIAPPTRKLESIFDRSITEVMEWESGLFDKLTGGRKTPLVLCGAGGLGQKILRGLRVVGIEPLAFADNNPALWGGQVEGLQVVNPGEAATRYGNEAVFVVAIWGAFSNDRLADRKSFWKSFGCKNVVSFHSLLWKYPKIFLPHYTCDLPHRVVAAREVIEEVYDLWCDDSSRSEFVKQLQWRSRLDYDGLPDPESGDTYFPSGLFTCAGESERFVDCGAFKGDTLEVFLKRKGNEFQHYMALEPDPENFSELRKTVSRLTKPLRKKIQVLPYAVFNRRTTLKFMADGSASSVLAEFGNVEVPAEVLDNLLAESSITFLKMDIEGGEPEALEGARRSIVRHRPVIAVSAYHRQNHLWSIPAWLNGVLDDYNYYLRPHDVEVWDLVCYAVPKEKAIL